MRPYPKDKDTRVGKRDSMMRALGVMEVSTLFPSGATTTRRDKIAAGLLRLAAMIYTHEVDVIRAGMEVINDSDMMLHTLHLEFSDERES